MKLRTTYILSFLFFMVVNTYAQRYPDSIINKINHEKNDSIRASCFISLASYYLTNNRSKSDSCLNEALKIGKKTGDERIQADVTMMFGNTNYLTGDYEKAISFYKKGNELYQKLNFKFGQGVSLMNIGLVHINRGNLGKGLEYELKAVNMFEKIDQKTNLGYVFNAIAVIYKEKKDYKKALIYQNKSLKINSKLKIHIGTTNNYINIGTIYALLNQNSKAKQNFNTAIKLAEKYNDETSLSNAYHELATIFSNENAFERADYYYKRALKIEEKNNDQQGTAATYTSLGQLRLKQKKYTEAIDYALKGLNKSIEIKSKSVEELAHTTLSDAYLALKQFEKAHYHLQGYIKIKDSLQELENKQNLLELQEKYHAENSEKEILRLNTKAIKSELDKQKERNFRNTILGGLLIVTILCIVIFYRFRIKQKSNAKLQQVYAIIREKQRETIESINYAKRLQEAILPPQHVINEYLPQSFILYKPKDIVAGDFYFLERTHLKNGNTLTIVAAADCTGHGVPGAMVSVVCSNALNRAVKEFKLEDPGKILDKVRELVIETFSSNHKNENPNLPGKVEIRDGMDISLCCIEKTNQGSVLHWAGANNPLWLIRQNELTEFKPDKQPIGKTSNPKPFLTHQVNLLENDLLYIFTDGFEDQFGGEKGKKFMSSRMKTLFITVNQYGMDEQMNKLNLAFEEWRCTKNKLNPKAEIEQIDDVCVIGIRI